MYEYGLKFNWFFSYGSNLQYSSIGSDNGLAPNRWQVIIWTNADLVRQRIYVALGKDELTHRPLRNIAIFSHV